MLNRKSEVVVTVVPVGVATAGCAPQDACALQIHLFNQKKEGYCKNDKHSKNVFLLKK